jgi:PqqD family protein of HPr-rel-A system
VRDPLTDDQHWRPARELVWTHYDDSEDWVVFHPQSGDVYLVTSAAHTLWALIADGSAPTLHQLIPALAAALNRTPDDELAAVTRDTLAFMDRAGLVRPISL